MDTAYVSLRLGHKSRRRFRKTSLLYPELS
jgi:hypothetical protein